MKKIRRCLLACVLASLHVAALGQMSETSINIANAVDAVIPPLMKRYDIPGMAVGITRNGKAYFYNFGVLSRSTQIPVSQQSLFEVGSITKVLTATGSTWLAEQGKLNLSKGIATSLHVLTSPTFKWISPINLLTHTSSLRFNPPLRVASWDALVDYLNQWKPPYPPGKRRMYSNLGIGLMGAVINQVVGEPIQSFERRAILYPLKMKDSFFVVPPNEVSEMAQGYDRQGKPVPQSSGLLGASAYGLKSCSEDLIHLLQANMGELNLSKKLQAAVDATHVSYYQTPYLVQDLVWEQYPFPTSIETVERGNGASEMSAPAGRMGTSVHDHGSVLLNKTGSTDGFSAYVVFVPDQKIGIVLLANKRYTKSANIKAAYELLTALTRDVAMQRDE